MTRPATPIPAAGQPARFTGSDDVPVLTAAQMQAWDADAIERRGVPQPVLMESAGRAVAAVVQRLYPDGRITAAVGSGNNGGDALVALRTLRAWGRDVVAVQAGGSMPDGGLLHGTLEIM